MINGDLMKLLLVLPYILLLAAISCEELEKPDVDKLFKDGQSATHLIKGNNEFIILVGSTGTGKSTLSKFLRKDETLTIVENEQLFCIFTDNETRIGSSDSLTSKTFFPNTDLDLQTGLPIVDMAGFRDTRSAEFDLVAAFFNKEVLNGASKMKIVIVENYSNIKLNNDRSAFVTTIKHVAQLLQGNTESLAESISLVVTKVNADKNDLLTIRAIEVILEKVEQYFKRQMDNLTKSNDTSMITSLREQISLVNYIKEKENIAIFREPKEVRSPWESGPLRKNYQDIRNLIFNRLNFSKRFSKDFEVSVAPETVIYIRDNLITTSRAKVDRLFKMQYEKLAENFGSIIGARYKPIEEKLDFDIKYCNNLLEFLHLITNFDQLESLNQKLTVRLEFKDELELEAKKMLFFYQVAEQQNFAKSSTEINNMLGWKHKLHADVRNARNFMKFLQSLIADFGLYSVQSSAPSNWYKYDSDLALFINYLSSLGFSDKPIKRSAGLADVNFKLSAILQDVIDEFKPRVENFAVDGNATIFSGINVVLSRISESISKFNGETHQIVIIATKKLFIDCDLGLQDTHLAMIAPVIEVFGTERTITLTGSSGAPLSRKAWNSNKSGVAGANGQHGKHGFSSGELKIIALQVSNEELLLVNSTGGSGSNGQSGGNGFSSNHVSHPEDYSRRVHLEHELLDHLRGRYHLGPITGPKEKVIPIPVAGVYTQVDFEITKYIRAEARGDGKESNGGNGGNGGNASGSGAIDILVRGTPKKIHLSEKNGAVGLAGEGGSAGVWNCLFKEFVCDGKKGSKWVLFIPVDRFRDKYEFTCRTNREGNCGRVAKSGRNGVAGRLVSKRYKFTPLKIHQLVMHFWREASKTTGKAELYPMDLYQFWNFLHRSKQVKLSIKEATSFPFIFDPTLEMAKDDTNFRRIQSDLSSMYMTFKNFKKECSTCNVNELEIIETTFASRLRILQTFNKNKRTSYLQNAVDDMIKKIEHIESSDGKILPEFFTLSPDIDEEIKSANERIKEITGVVLSGIKNEIEKDFEEISLAYQNLQSETELKSKLSATLKLKAQLEVFSTISKISSALHYFAEGMTKNEIPDNEIYFPDEFMAALDVLKFVIFRKLEVHRETTPQQIAAVKTLLEEDMNYGGVLKQKSDRTQLLEILEQKEGMEENFGNEIQNVLETVESDLDEKILELKLSANNSNALEIERLIKLQKTLKDARYSISGEIYKFALQKLPDNTSLHEIRESNKLFMQQLDWYGKTINENFNSFLFMMQAILVNFKKSDVEDFLPGAVQKFTRKLIYTIEKFTSDLPEVRKKFGGHFYELEKVLQNVIDAMDKFDEINYLTKIENFLSNCPEGNCGQDETIAMIASNEFVRLFAHYWSAYQQISFPHATDQINFFKNTLKELNKLKESSFKERIVVLKKALKSMSKDLSNENNNFSFGQFNSKYAASKSFYTWPNHQFSSQIKKILNGEETIMAASVFSPGVKNAVKFNSVFLNFTSSANPKVTRDINDLLTHFRLEMRHPGESNYRCGNMIYSVGGDPIFFTANFARDENGQFISRSSAFASLKQSANSFSPYAVWKFRLVPNSDRDRRHLIKELSGFVGKVDLELVGSGFYLEEDADSCAKDQGQFYTYFGTK